MFKRMSSSLTVCCDGLLVTSPVEERLILSAFEIARDYWQKAFDSAQDQASKKMFQAERDKYQKEIDELEPLVDR